MSIDVLFSDLASLTNPFSLFPKTIFRGQGNANWSLNTSFARAAQGRRLTREQALQLEREGINKFSVSARTVLPLEQTETLKWDSSGALDFLGWSVLMQHFSAPTRTLDWSRSPWVALYFACSGHPNEDGAVWAADFSITVSNAEKELGGKNFAELMCLASSTEVVHFITARNSNERIEAQQGLFSACTNPLADHAPALYRAGALRKIVIPHALKEPAMVRLHGMNITARTLFPGADGLGKSISEFYAFWDMSSRIA